MGQFNQHVSQLSEDRTLLCKHIGTTKIAFRKSVSIFNSFPHFSTIYSVLKMKRFKSLPHPVEFGPGNLTGVVKE